MSLQAILYVEDEESDVILLRYALRKAKVSNPLLVVGDGEEGMAYLGGRGQYADREKYPLPALVLLDLNLPRVPGMKLLEWIRRQPSLTELPVVIYTSSNQPNDLKDAKRLNANEYVVKPSGIDKITEIVETLKERWLQPAS